MEGGSLARMPLAGRERRWSHESVDVTCIGNISERVNEEPQSSRGRSKYSTYGSNFKAGRKSSSLMNLCGKRSLINTRYGLTHVVGIRATVAWCVGFLSVAAGGAASALSTAPLSTVHCPLLRLPLPTDSIWHYCYALYIFNTNFWADLRQK